MKKEIFDTIKKEIKYIALLLLVILAVFKIAFFSEDFIVLFRNVMSLFWLFVIPGWFIMLHWSDKIKFLERAVAGTAISAGIIGISSYYIGLIGLNIKYHAVIFPVILIFVGILMNSKK